MGTIANRSIDVHPNHACPTERAVSICCVDELGTELIWLACTFIMQLWLYIYFNNRNGTHYFSFILSVWTTNFDIDTGPTVTCYCTKSSAGLYFNLLDWAEALMYECQVALKDLWGALQYKVPNLKKVNCQLTAFMTEFTSHSNQRVFLTIAYLCPLVPI